MSTVQRHCLYCDQPFNVSAWDVKKKFCSKKCSDERRSLLQRFGTTDPSVIAEILQRRCVHCGKPFVAKNLNRRYCSKLCWNASNHASIATRRRENTKKRLAKIVKECPVCDRKFSPKHKKSQKYCSHRCRRRSREHGGRFETLPCPECLEPFLQRRGNQKFCTQSCRLRYNAREYQERKRSADGPSRRDRYEKAMKKKLENTRKLVSKLSEEAKPDITEKPKKYNEKLPYSLPASLEKFRLMKADEVAWYFSVSTNTIHRWAREGLLKTRRLPNGRPRWLLEDLEAVIKPGEPTNTNSEAC